MMARLKTLTRSLLLTLLLAGIDGLLATNAWAIKKCQDSEGNWHYGDFAVHACSQSKITTLDARGNITEEQEAPLTDQEKQAQAEALRLEKEQLAKETAQREERNRILSIYETEADIERQRDNQLYSVQSNIDVTKAYIKSLKDRQATNKTRTAAITNSVLKQQSEADGVELMDKLTSADKQLLDLYQQKKNVEMKFERELDLYRELRNSEE